jgi:hypothetical protein
MTGRRLLAIGAVGFGLAAVGMLARPLLPAAHRVGAQRSAPAAVDRVPAWLVARAVAAARASVACHGHVPLQPRACGQLIVTASAGYRSAPSQVAVQVVGTLASDGGAVPVALRVRLTDDGNRWTAAVVAP